MIKHIDGVCLNEITSEQYNKLKFYLSISKKEYRINCELNCRDCIIGELRNDNNLEKIWESLGGVSNLRITFCHWLVKQIVDNYKFVKLEKLLK